MTPPSPDHTSDSRSSAEIEADIRRTRGRMDATLDELGERLTARHLINTALDWWETPRGSRGTHAVRKAAGTLGHTFKEHPMPSLLIGAGIAWMLMEAREEEETIVRPGTGMRSISTRRPVAGGTRTDVRFELESDYDSSLEDGEPGLGEKMKHKMEDMGSGVKEGLGSAKERISHSRERMGEWTHERSQLMGRRARRTLQRGRTMTHRMHESLEESYHSGVERFEDAVEEHPLAVGLGFAALGALIGVLLPRSRREDEWLGEQSDHLMEMAREKGEDLLERGKAVGERVAEAAMEGAREQGLTTEAALGAIGEIKHKVGEVVHRAKEEAGTALEEEHLTPEALKEEAVEASGAGEGESTSAPSRMPERSEFKQGPLASSERATEAGYGDIVKTRPDDGDPANRPAF